MNDTLQIQERVIEVLRTVYDPEIPVNIYDLGLIYRIELNDDATELSVDMTLTAPNCPAADFILEDVRQKLETISGINKVDVQLVFEPEWNKDMMSEEAKVELGFL
jgi:FeS assembly SUF system protein